MANSTIQEIVNQIRTAIYGRDVRENIALGIETCYEDTAQISISRIGQTDDYLLTLHDN